MEVKKILVKFPRSNEDVFQCFPFLITLSEEFPKAELNVIVEEGGPLAFAYLPFKVNVFERPASKLSLIETHHFCANLHDVFNIDLFIDLENSFNSAFIGFNFRAKERYGYLVKWNKYLLTKSLPDEPTLGVEKKSLKLLEFITGKSFSDVRVGKTFESGQQIEKIEKLFKEPEPPNFIMIMLDSFAHVSTQIELWKNFFDCFHGQKFVIWTLNDEDIISELFASIDLGHNNLFIQKGRNPKEMVYLFSKVKGVIVNNSWAEGLCTYFGVDSLSFCENKEGWYPYSYFRVKPQRMLFRPNEPIAYHFQEEVRQFSEMNQVVDQIHLNFKL